MSKVYANLNVNGNFVYNNNPTNGYILTTDVDGHISFTQSNVIESINYTISWSFLGKVLTKIV